MRAERVLALPRGRPISRATRETAALIAGASNLITPKATIDAVTPAFLFLAACGLAIGLAFETHGMPLALQAPQPAENAGTGAVHLGREGETVAARPTPS